MKSVQRSGFDTVPFTSVCFLGLDLFVYFYFSLSFLSCLKKVVAWTSSNITWELRDVNVLPDPSPTPRHKVAETLGVGPATCILTSPSRDAEASSFENHTLAEWQAH